MAEMVDAAAIDDERAALAEVVAPDDLISVTSIVPPRRVAATWGGYSSTARTREDPKIPAIRVDRRPRVGGVGEALDTIDVFGSIRAFAGL